MLLARTSRRQARYGRVGSAPPHGGVQLGLVGRVIDTDQNPQTGGLAYTGADSMIDLSFNSVDLASWNGSDFHVMDQSPGSLVWSYANGVATIGGIAGGRTTCRWQLPKGSKHKRLHGMVSVSVQGLEVTKSSSVIVT